MFEAKPVGNSFLEGTKWTLLILKFSKNRQQDKAQVFESHTGEAKIY